MIDSPVAFAKRFAVSRETLDKLETYVDLLKFWQKTINLVSPATLDAAWHRHIADSAQLLALAPPVARTWVDLGSGAGFPGLVLAILLQEQAGWRMTLVESDTRKVAFLREVVRKTALPSMPGALNPAPDQPGCVVDICQARIEIASTQDRLARSDVISARALAPLPKLLGLCLPFAGEQTVALLPKGRDVEREIADARAEWSFALDTVASMTEPDARIAIVTKLKPRPV